MEISNKNTTNKKIIFLIGLCILISIIPLFLLKNAEFGGSDDAASKAISDIDPDYKVWAKPIFELPSSEVESLLFCVQAAIGAGILGYAIGTLKERNKHKKAKKGESDYE